MTFFTASIQSDVELSTFLTFQGFQYVVSGLFFPLSALAAIPWHFLFLESKITPSRIPGRGPVGNKTCSDSFLRPAFVHFPHLAFLMLKKTTPAFLY
jgi:hypothetical protein